MTLGLARWYLDDAVWPFSFGREHAQTNKLTGAQHGCAYDIAGWRVKHYRARYNTVCDKCYKDIHVGQMIVLIKGTKFAPIKNRWVHKACYHRMLEEKQNERQSKTKPDAGVRDGCDTAAQRGHRDESNMQLFGPAYGSTGQSGAWKE